MGIQAVTTFWLLWIMWACMYKFLCGQVFISLGHTPRGRLARVESYGSFTLGGNIKLFSNVAAPFKNPLTMYKGSSFSTSLRRLLLSFILAILASVKEPGGLQSMGSLSVRHDWVTSLSLFTFKHWRRKWQTTPVFLPGESQGRGNLVGCCLWGRTESDTVEVL